jgi:hypothetical protein
MGKGSQLRPGLAPSDTNKISQNLLRTINTKRLDLNSSPFLHRTFTSLTEFSLLFFLRLRIRSPPDAVKGS